MSTNESVVDRYPPHLSNQQLCLLLILLKPGPPAAEGKKRGIIVVYRGPRPRAGHRVTMRRLIHIPIVHSSAELGSLAASVQAHHAKVLGETAWHEREQAIEGLWKHIRERVLALHLDDRHTRIYQDGLPVCDFEEKIVREIARAGSPNHQLILELVERGATLMGTEDPRLLMEEYEIQKGKLENRAVSDQAGQERTRTDDLLAARDRFIAKRIEDTLQEGETGLLFLGALHPFDELQATDIEVVRLD